MTAAQKRLRELRERQSKERGRMAELSLLEELTDEQRSELDQIERGTPDLERQTRAAVVAAEDEEKEAETRAATEPDAEQRERIELRSKASLSTFCAARFPASKYRVPRPSYAPPLVSPESRSNFGTCRNKRSSAPRQKRPAQPA